MSEWRGKGAEWRRKEVRYCWTEKVRDEQPTKVSMLRYPSKDTVGVRGESGRGRER